jgi:hypothetical protein|tara:strand:+ start:965 stop:1276 length:312 start_codon:yes stop_codon:yes gene_type:complete
MKLSENKKRTLRVDVIKEINDYINNVLNDDIEARKDMSYECGQIKPFYTGGLIKCSDLRENSFNLNVRIFYNKTHYQLEYPEDFKKLPTVDKAVYVGHNALSK